MLGKPTDSRAKSGNVFIGKGMLAGKAVYAARDFKKGEIVIKYNLKALTKEELVNLADAEKQFVHFHEGRPMLYSEPERFVNDSLSPNTIQDLTIGADVALIDIRKDEMITTDASKDDSHAFYRVTVEGKGIYEAVDRYCPENDPRRKNKPDGSWLPKVGMKYPGAISFWTEDGWKKYQESGLFDWHKSVCGIKAEVQRITKLPGEVVYQDTLQVIVRPRT